MSSLGNNSTARETRRHASTLQPHRLRPPQRYKLPDFGLRKRAADLPAPRAQKFENKVILPNSQTISIYTTSPRPQIPINKATTNHPLWAFADAAGQGMQDDEGGRMGRFARKFAGADTATSRPGQARRQVEKQADKAVGAAKSAQVAEAAPGSEASDAATMNTAKTTASKSSSTPPQEDTASDALDLFDLSLEGEVYEEVKRKVVEEGGKKGKKGAAAGKKGGKK